MRLLQEQKTIFTDWCNENFERLIKKNMMSPPGVVAKHSVQQPKEWKCLKRHSEIKEKGGCINEDLESCINEKRFSPTGIERGCLSDFETASFCGHLNIIKF